MANSRTAAVGHLRAYIFLTNRNPQHMNPLPCSTHKYYFFCLLLLLLLKVPARAQDPSQPEKTGPQVSFSAVADVFYSYDFNRPATGIRQPFVYNHNRHNEFNLNLGLLRAAVAHEKYRAAIGLQGGTYAQDNYAAEQPLLRPIYEAYAGISLNPKNSLWLDAGIFGSHIGFESAVTSENWTPTRSLLAENSPYFLSGVKLTYQPTAEWLISAVVTNGWQHIQRLPGNTLLSFGTQVQYVKEERFILNWSTFVGTDDPDSTRRMRYFNNVYGQFKLSPRLGLIAGFDLGLQQSSKGSSEYVSWLSPVLIARYLLNDRWATAVRAEYYADPSGLIVPLLNAHDFATSGFSANLDYQPAEAVMWRLEGRWFHSPDKIFETETGQFSKNNFFITSTLTVSFGS